MQLGILSLELVPKFTVYTLPLELCTVNTRALTSSSINIFDVFQCKLITASFSIQTMENNIAWTTMKVSWDSVIIAMTCNEEIAENFERCTFFVHLVGNLL